MIFKVFVSILIFCCWSIAVDLQEKRNDSSQCGGWGTRIENLTHYHSMRHTCYLAIRRGKLCCIEKPACPEGLRPEIPIKPYHLFPLKKLSLGCVKQDEGKKKTRKNKIEVTVCYHETAKKGN